MACRYLGVPVVSGNVSLYNESRGQAIYPTPVLGGLGVLEDASRHCQSAFPGDGLSVALLGRGDLRPRKMDLAGSEYLQVVQGLVAGRPALDLALESRVQDLCRRLIGAGVAASAHDCAEGGLAVALAESCIQGGVGFTGSPASSVRWDMTMFGEGQSRIVISLAPQQWPQLEELASRAQVPILNLGTTGGSNFQWGSRLNLPVAEIAQAWRNGLNPA